MDIVELHFSIIGQSLPVRHGYQLYAALSQALPAIHAADAALSIGPISGDYLGKGLLRLNQRSRLRVRTPAKDIGTLLPLAGQAFELGGHKIRLGVPNVRALLPSPALGARLVMMKIHGIASPTPEGFLNAVRRRMDEHSIKGELHLPFRRFGPQTGHPYRRVLRVKEYTLVGYALQVTGLSSEDSIRLQANCPFGKRRMGCGFFVPLKQENTDVEI
jgi:CRISPR-associated protein Cas6